MFNDPTDRFAAFFIGSPGMNFIDLTLAADGLHVAADQSLRVSAPNTVLEHARAEGLNQIVLGIRPHMVELANEEGRDVLPAKLLDAALVGRDLQTQFSLAGQTIQVVLPLEVEPRDGRGLRLPPRALLVLRTGRQSIGRTLMSQIMLAIQGLNKRFGSKLALDGIDVTVMEGEVLGLLGPTGAGKTTTLRCISGLHRPDAGKIWLAGEDVNKRLADGARYSCSF